jgi:OOP family OmpA-OmpF porin
MHGEIKMKALFPLIVIWAGLYLMTPGPEAQESSQLDQLQLLLDSTVLVEANVFAPEAFTRAQDKLTEAKRAIELKKKQQSIDNLLGEAREYAENALKAAEVAKLSLSEYLAPRDKARKYHAPTLVPELYQKAEEQFIRATQKVEAGDVKGGLKEAEKAAPLFDAAELEAIKTDIMGKAAALIEKAVTDEAQKFAPATLDKARTAYTRCDEILTSDRYNRDKSLEAISLAEYEAQHASNIAQSVRSLERNDQAWEKLMLFYEIEMQKVGTTLGIKLLPFHSGPAAAADSMVAAVKTLQSKEQSLEETQSKVAAQLQNTLGTLNAAATGDDPVELAGVLNTVVNGLLDEKSRLSASLAEKQDNLALLKQTHDEVASELEARREKEEKIKQARKMLKPTEGDVLFNATNDIVLRLFGLSFASGSSEITDEHVPLLDKVEKILEMFPGANLMVEGHTDDLGDRVTNMQLSEKRALAVMQYLRKSMSIPADKIDAVGYGPDRPIGTSTTAEGRAKNRRIDIVIFQ